VRLHLRTDLARDAAAPSTLIVFHQIIKNLIQGDALLLWANEMPRTDLIRMNLFQFLVPELDRPFFVCFVRALAVLFTAQVISAPLKRTTWPFENASVSPHFLPPFVRRGLSQYGELHFGQDLGFCGRRGYQEYPQRKD